MSVLRDPLDLCFVNLNLASGATVASVLPNKHRLISSECFLVVADNTGMSSPEFFF